MPRTGRVVSSSPLSASDQTRLLLVEDVPQVTQHIRGLLNAQSRVKLLDVLDDGTKALGTIRELRPDVVIVDWLLQGRLKGPRVVDAIREADLDVPVIVLTVPNAPVEPNPTASAVYNELLPVFRNAYASHIRDFDLLTAIARAE